MGRKGNWFNAVKKALGTDTKEKKDQKIGKKKKWFRKKKQTTIEATPPSTTVETAPATAVLSTSPPKVPSDPEVVKLPITSTEAGAVNDSKVPEILAEDQDEQTKHASAFAAATAKAAEAAATAAQAAAEVVRLTKASNMDGKSKEEMVAIKIQTAFRGYLARRQLRALRGLVRLKILMQGHSVKRQTTNTLKSMQTLARVQSQIRASRLKMAEENLARQRHLLQKHGKDFDKPQMSGDWDISGKSKEQIETTMQSKQEAAVRRERAMAYAFNHQQTWRNSPTPTSSTTTNTLFMDPNNPHWGWGWLERWLAARPWETANLPEKEPHTASNSPIKGSPRTPIKSSKQTTTFSHDLIEKQSNLKPKQNRPSTGRLSTSTPPSKSVSSSTRKPKPAATRTNANTSSWVQDDDARSVLSINSEHVHGRLSIGGSSIRDDESLASSPAVPSYMAATESARAKSRSGTVSPLDTHEVMDRLSVSSVKKRISYPNSPVRSRRSTSSNTDI